MKTQKEENGELIESFSNDDQFFIVDELKPYLELASQFAPKGEEKKSRACSIEESIDSIITLQLFDQNHEFEPRTSIEKLDKMYLHRYDEFLKYEMKFNVTKTKFYHDSFKAVLETLKNLDKIDKNPYEYLTCSALYFQNSRPILLWRYLH